MPRGVYKRKTTKRPNPGVVDDIPTISKSSLVRSSISQPPVSDGLTVDRQRNGSTYGLTIKRGDTLILRFE